MKAKCCQRSVVYYGATAGLGASMGLLIGGLIASFVSWRVGFLINVPIGIIMFCLTLWGVKNQKSSSQNRQLDLLGAILSVIGMSALVYAIDGRQGRVAAVIIAVIALTWFIFHENRTAVFSTLDTAFGSVYQSP